MRISRRFTASAAGLALAAGLGIGACGGSTTARHTAAPKPAASSSRPAPAATPAVPVISKPGQSATFVYSDATPTTARQTWTAVQEVVVDHRVSEGAGEWTTLPAGEQYLGLTVTIHNDGPSNLPDAAALGQWSWAGTGKQAGQVAQISEAGGIGGSNLGLKDSANDLNDSPSLPAGDSTTGTIEFVVPAGHGSIVMTDPSPSNAVLVQIIY